MKQKIVLIGHGNVGKALYEQLSGLTQFAIAGVVVKHLEKKRNVPESLLTGNADALIEDPDVHIVLEAIDDADAALEYARKTLELGKTYISASKKMIAGNLPHLHYLVRKYGGKLLFEASVGGAIPVLRTIRDHLAGEHIERIRGIVNGSCNYILTRMAEGNIEFEAALKEAQSKGFAESDPASDIDAWDSYYKAQILAYTAFGDKPDFARVKWEGIRNVTLKDVADATASGEKIKLVADIQRQEERFTIDIRPTRIGPSDPLFHIDREYNGIIIQGKYTGPVLLQGAGAGGNPTASAMIGDLVNAPRGNFEMVRKLLLAMN